LTIHTEVGTEQHLSQKLRSQRSAIGACAAAPESEIHVIVLGSIADHRINHCEMVRKTGVQA
jgi:hypothetical protein